MSVLENAAIGGALGGGLGAQVGAGADWLGGRMDAWFGTDPAPTSSQKIEQAADRSLQIGKDQFDFNKSEYDANKERLGNMDKTNQGVVDSQLGMSKDYQDRSTSEWDRFKTQFQPVQDKMVSDAMNIDSAANQELAAGAAAGQVKSSVANAQAQNARKMASMGINPASGASVDSANSTAMTQAAQESTAMNGARDALKTQGANMRTNVAQFGQGVADQSMRLGNQAVQTGNSAVATGNVGFDNSLKNTAVMNSGYGAVADSNKTGADILNKDFANKMEGYKAEQTGKAGVAGAIGSVVGMVGSSLFSSKKLKENKKPVNDSDTLKKLKETPVGSWKYKKGIADEGKHTGAYAEDVQKNFGDHVAPGGKTIDVISAIGISMSAIKGVAKQVDKLSAKVDKLQRSA